EPTSQLTSFPTLQPDAPKLISLTLVPHGFNITANVILDGNAKYAGSVYCAPLLVNTQVTSVSQIVSAGTAVDYPAYATRLRVFMLGLVPQTSYDVYCYVVTAQGDANSLPDVLSTKTSTVTTCCRQASFTNTPAFIYADSSKYGVSTPLTEYTIIFTLSHLPSRNITFSPRILNATTGFSVSSAVIQASPGSFMLLSTSSPATLTGSFVLLVSNPALSATIRMYLSLTGESQFDYIPPPMITINILSSSDAPPAPIFRSASFSNKGNSMYLIFDSATNLGQKVMGQSWTCADLFDFQGNVLTDCVWINDTTIEGVFSSVSEDLLPRIGSRVMLKANLIQAACPNDASESNCEAFTNAAAKNVTLEPPRVPLVPSAILSVPSAIGSCDNLIVNAALSTGHAGRNWTQISWSISSLDTTVNTTVFANYLNAKTGSLLRSILVPRTLLASTLYSITVRLTNFLGAFNSATSTVQVTSDAFKPRLSILGSTSLFMTARLALTLPSRAQFSACTPTNITTLTYSWSVQNVMDSVAITSIVSVSSDPSMMFLPSYSLVAGQVYIMTVNCSAAKGGTIVGMSLASAQVTVVQGLVVALVSGGTMRQIPINMNVSLDSSASYDENVSSKTHLQHTWTCMITKLGSLYGRDCTSVLAQTKQKTVVVIGNKLDMSLSYSVQVAVSSSDGRTGIAQVAITAQTADSPYTEILVSSFGKFNADQNLSLSGLAQSSIDATLLWSMSISQQNVSAASYTPLQRSYPASLMIPSVISSILLAANSFQGGTQITFRLTASSTYSTGKDAVSRRLTGIQATTTVKSFSEVTLITNISPTGGSFTASPSSGYALDTEFTMESLGWVDDPADYPLSYDFRFSTNIQASILTIQSKSLNNIATSEFPAGIQAFENRIVVFARVFDIYDAHANANASVLMVLNQNLDVSGYLLGRLTSSLNSGNVDLGLQVVNNVASTINIVNCSAVSNVYCRNLNRKPCFLVPNTCGPCLDAYIGVAGSANIACLLANSTRNVGNTCIRDSDCIFGLCSNGTCSVPIKNCPSNSADICSGFGQCVYRDTSGNYLNSSACVESNVFCNALCECDVGHLGAACSLTPEAAAQRDADRGLMCSGLNNISFIGDATGALLESLAGSLATVYVGTEVASDSTASTCQGSLSIISSLAQQGYISASAPDTGLYLTRSVSAFVEHGGNVNNGKVISDSLTDIASGLLGGMTNGQMPIDLVADNVQITLRNDLYLDLVNTSLSPPSTSAESQYGTPPLTVGLRESTAGACANDQSFVQLTVMKWSTNPFANSSDVLSPILRLGTSGAAGSATGRVGMSSMSLGNTHRKAGHVHEDILDHVMAPPRPRVLSTSASNDESSGYTITLQFASSQAFNLSISPEDARKHPPNNFTFPGCTFQDGEKYTACTGCNVSTYTNFNVTYLCTDASQICADSSSSRYHHLPMIQADDGTSTGQGMSMAQYGALFTAIKGVLLNTLSTNPFDINIEEAKVILSLVGSIVLVWCGGCVLFFQWDKHDKLQLIYSKRWPPAPYKSDRSKGKKRLLEWLEDKLVRDRRKDILTQNDDKDVVVDSFTPTETSKTLGTNYQKNSAGKLSQEPVKLLDNLVSGASSFFDAVFPAFTRQSSWNTFVQIVLSRHDYLTCFFSPSLTNGRLLRWISLWKSILIVLFVDTVFFSVFYSNDGLCETYTTQSTCELAINSITNDPKCEWTSKDNNGSCELREPPSDIMFTMSLALICVIVGVPIDILFSYVLNEYASKRPQLEQVDLDSQYWLGVSTALNNINTTEELNNDMHPTSTEDLSDLGKEFSNAKERWPEQTQCLMQASECTSQPIYARYHTPREELDRLIQIVQAHFAEHNAVDLHASALEAEIQRELYRHRSDALRLLLGINADGSLQALYPWEYLYYRSNQNKLLHRLKLIKRRQAAVLEAVEAAGSLSPEAQEVTLLQYFILEQFTSFQKWILRNQLFSFESFSPEEIDVFQWIAAWTFVIGSLLFYVYWVLAWGVSSGNALLNAWGLNFIIGAIQDIFFVQIAKLFILYAVAIFTIRPHLQSMRMILQSLTLSYMSGNLPPRKVYMYLLHARELEAYDTEPGKGTSEQDKEVRNSMSTFRVIQHFSPACRAAWFDSCRNLGMAKLLKNLDDADAMQFAYVRSSQVSLSAILLAGLPFQLYAVFGDSMGNVLVDFLLPTVSSFFIVANALLFQASAIAILCIYLILGVYGIYQSGLWKLAVRHVRARRIGWAGKAVSPTNPPSLQTQPTVVLPLPMRRTDIYKELAYSAYAAYLYVHTIQYTLLRPFPQPQPQPE
ncbi:hypothetical protein EON65_27185, partial [archaeon]